VTVSTQQEKRAQRREQIIALTWRLIAREGLRAASMRAIAAEAGYANGALAYYFAGKDDLVRAAFEYVLAQTAARIARVTAGLTGLWALEKFCDEVIPHDEEKPSRRVSSYHFGRARCTSRSLRSCTKTPCWHGARRSDFTFARRRSSARCRRRARARRP
jgi:AcrR family transcriptional regulator